MPRVPQGRVTLRGTVASGLDIWTSSFAIDPLSARTQAQLQDLAEEIGGLFEAHVWSDDTLEDRWSQYTAFTGCRVDDVRDPGGVVRTADWARTEPLTGASADAPLPSQCAHVVSLRTGLPGPRYRGRMYLPGFGVSQMTVEGQIAAGAASDLANGMAAFFDAVNDSVVAPATAFVASDAAQQLTAITSVQVGTTVDTQRRRRDAVPEIYSTAAV
jgi:hypothetical protein